MNNKILPLFRIPLNVNNLKDTRKLNLNTNINLNHLSLNKILKLYLKAFSLYNNNFITYLHKHNNLDLILQIKKEAQRESLNIKISNYFYTLNKLFLKIKINSLLFNLNLFLPTQILNTYPNIKYINNINYISKNILNISQSFSSDSTNSNY